MERVFRGIKMETKQQFLEEINKVKGSKRDYLNKLFQYVLEAVIRAAVHKNVKKDEFIIRAGEPCDTVYIILKGDVAGVDYQKLGKVYYFMDFAKMYIVGDFEIFSEVWIRWKMDIWKLYISAKMQKSRMEMSL